MDESEVDAFHGPTWKDLGEVESRVKQVVASHSAIVTSFGQIRKRYESEVRVARHVNRKLQRAVDKEKSSSDAREREVLARKEAERATKSLLAARAAHASSELEAEVRISELEQDLRAMRDQLSQARDTAAGASARMDIMAQSMSRARSSAGQRTEDQKRIERLEGIIADLEAAQSGRDLQELILRNKLDEALAAQAEAEEEVAECRDTLAKLGYTESSESLKLQSLEATIQRQEDDLKKLSLERARLRSENETLASKIRTNNNALSAHEATISAHEATINAQQTQVRNVEGQVTALRLQLDQGSRNAGGEELRERLAARNDEVSALKRELQVAQEELGDAKGELDEVQAELVEVNLLLRQSRATETRSSASLRKQLEALSLEQAQTATDIKEEARARLAACEGELERERQDSAALRAALEEASGGQRDMGKRLAEAVREKSRLQASVNNYEQKLKRHTASLEDAQQQQRMHKEELESMRVAHEDSPVRETTEEIEQLLLAKEVESKLQLQAMQAHLAVQHEDQKSALVARYDARIDSLTANNDNLSASLDWERRQHAVKGNRDASRGASSDASQVRVGQRDGTPSSPQESSDDVPHGGKRLARQVLPRGRAASPQENSSSGGEGSPRVTSRPAQDSYAGTNGGVAHAARMLREDLEISSPVATPMSEVVFRATPPPPKPVVSPPTAAPSDPPVTRGSATTTTASFPSTLSTVSVSDYTLYEVLGRGSFGQVQRALSRLDGSTFAVKTIHTRDTGDAHPSVKDKIRSVVAEVVCTYGLTHPNIVQYVGMSYENYGVHFVLEYCGGGTLRAKIRRECINPRTQLPFKFWSEAKCMRYFVKICLGVKFLHESDVLHRDLKSENVFLTIDDDVRIGDYGMARILARGESDSEPCGTLEYAPPEMVARTEYDKRADVWALGIILYEMLSGGSLPFNKTHGRDTLRYNILNSPHSRLSSSYSAGARGAVDSLLSKSRDARPFIEEVMLMPLMQSAMRTHLTKDERALFTTDGSYLYASTASSAARKSEARSLAAAIRLQIEEDNQRASVRTARSPVSSTTARYAHYYPQQRRASPQYAVGRGYTYR